MSVKSPLKNFTVKSNSIKILSLSVIITAMIISTTLPLSLTYAKSPYDSGYDHGCNDANISNPSNQYINQPEKGPSYHTSEFMNGYNSGFNSCGSSSNSAIQQPQQQQSDRGFDGTVNKCKEDTSTIRGFSDTSTLVMVLDVLWLEV